MDKNMMADDTPRVLESRDPVFTFLGPVGTECDG
jgi:hypothetical protein